MELRLEAGSAKNAELPELRSDDYVLIARVRIKNGDDST